eukprot:m.122945 g.122945  ORF g.122945 m.122945 type:complete len:110 (+) comp9398_c1_seq1:190-519(+)
MPRNASPCFNLINKEEEMITVHLNEEEKEERPTRRSLSQGLMFLRHPLSNMATVLNRLEHLLRSVRTFVAFTAKSVVTTSLGAHNSEEEARPTTSKRTRETTWLGISGE